MNTVDSAESTLGLRKSKREPDKFEREFGKSLPEAAARKLGSGKPKLSIPANYSAVVRCKFCSQKKYFVRIAANVGFAALYQ